MNRLTQVNQTNNGSTGADGSVSNLAVSTHESIKLMAESIGISNLSDEACREIVNDLTFTVKSIIIDAQRFARRSRRKCLTSSDVDFSLKARSIEPIYGFCSNDQIPFRCTTSSGGNGGGRSIYYVDDQVLDLNDIISVNNLSIKLPNDFVINAHWLAIEGVQPAVPENPQLVSREVQKKDAIEGATSSKLKEKQTVQIQNKNIGENLVKLKTLVPHDLSMEQQFYFKEITEACVSSDEQKRTEALNSLSIDPGLHQLLPRLILFISEGVRLNIIQTNLAILIYLMRMAKALIENKSIYLEKYLHELLPSIFSCLLSKQLCARPEIDNHYALREYCARLIGQVLKTYGPTLTFLQTRIIKVYLNSIESDKTTFATLFGAIVGVAELGDDIFESIMFPVIKPIGERLAQILDSNATNQEKLPAEKVKQEIIKIVSNILATKAPQSEDELEFLNTKFGAYFGPSIHQQILKLRNHQQLTNPNFQFASSAPKPNKTINTSQFINTKPNSNIQPQSNAMTKYDQNTKTETNLKPETKLVNNESDQSLKQSENNLNDKTRSGQTMETNVKTDNRENQSVNFINTSSFINNDAFNPNPSQNLMTNSSNNLVNESAMSKSSTDDDWFF